MALLSIKAKNFGIHKNLDINLNGESALIVGDSGTGKSTLFKLILSHLDQYKYPSNPLKDGEKEGFSETTYQSKDGKVYTIRRNFVRKEDGSVDTNRFEVRGPDGRKKSLEEIMDTVFNGVFTHARFDYDKYFNKTSSATARYKYFVEAIGGDIIDKNFEEIDDLEKQRAKKGNDRDIQKGIWEGREYSEETIVSDQEYYAQERTVEDAAIAKENHLAKKKSDKELVTALNKHNAAAESTASNQMIINDAEFKIAELQLLIAEQRKIIEHAHAEKLKVQPDILTPAKHNALSRKISDIEKFNKKIEDEAEALYVKTLNEIVEFITDQQSFYGGLVAFQKWAELDKEWNDLNDRIKKKREDNQAVLKSILPLPELSIGEAGTEKNRYPIILYNGREFGPEYLSTGEAIQITAAIQLALNPNGDNFMVIPQAQSLGSKLKEVMDACKKFNVQFLVEMTKPDEEFHVEVIES